MTFRVRIYICGGMHVDSLIWIASVYIYIYTHNGSLLKTKVCTYVGKVCEKEGKKKGPGMLCWCTGMPFFKRVWE